MIVETIIFDTTHFKDEGNSCYPKLDLVCCLFTKRYSINKYDCPGTDEGEFFSCIIRVFI